LDTGLEQFTGQEGVVQRVGLKVQPLRLQQLLGVLEGHAVVPGCQPLRGVTLQVGKRLRAGFQGLLGGGAGGAGTGLLSFSQSLMEPAGGQLLGLGLGELVRGLGSGPGGKALPELDELQVQAVGFGPALLAGPAVVDGPQAEGQHGAPVVRHQIKGDTAAVVPVGSTRTAVDALAFGHVAHDSVCSSHVQQSASRKPLVGLKEIRNQRVMRWGACMRMISRMVCVGPLDKRRSGTLAQNAAGLKPGSGANAGAAER